PSKENLPRGEVRASRRSRIALRQNPKSQGVWFAPDSPLEGAGFEPSVPRNPSPALGYSLLIMKSLTATDSAPRPRLCDQQAVARWRSCRVEEPLVSTRIGNVKNN